MNALNGTMECQVVSVLEEQMWLDRREDACAFFPRRRVGLAALKQRLREFGARMQMGPVSEAETWLERHREARF